MERGTAGAPLGPWRRRVWRGVRVCDDQMRMVRSLETDATKAPRMSTPTTVPVCPSRTPSECPEVRSQSRTVRSPEPETSMVFDFESARAETDEAWPSVRAWRSAPSGSEWMYISLEAETTMEPSCETMRERMPASACGVWSRRISNSGSPLGSLRTWPKERGRWRTLTEPSAEPIAILRALGIRQAVTTVKEWKTRVSSVTRRERAGMS